MPRTPFIPGLIGIVAIVILFLWRQNNEPAPSAEKTIPELPKAIAVNRPLLIKQFMYTTSDEYGLDNILEADELEVKPRRFMAFNLKSVNEAIVRNAHLTVYTHDRREAADKYFGFERAIPLAGADGDNSGRSRVLGLVTRMIIDTINMELFRDEQKVMILDAASGLIEKKKEGVKFFNATLQDVRTNRFVKAGKILWDRKRKVFIIPGRYVMNDSSRSVAGQSVEIDLDFMMTPYGRQPHDQNQHVSVAHQKVPTSLFR